MHIPLAKKDFILKQLFKCINNEIHECKISIPLYGPNVDYSQSEESMLYYALENAYYFLTLKGYKYTSSKYEEQVLDALEGTCTKCDKIIIVQLK